MLGFSVIYRRERRGVFKVGFLVGGVAARFRATVFFRVRDAFSARSVAAPRVAALAGAAAAAVAGWNALFALKKDR